MKKIGISFILLFVSQFLFASHVFAKRFTEEANYNYRFKISWYDGVDNTLNKVFVKMTNEVGDAYFDVDPKSSFFFLSQYEQKDSDLSFDLLQKLSKIMYYGYGYKDNFSDSYYFATQYLIYSAFEGLTVDITDNKHISSLDFSSAIQEIQDNINNHSFSIRDFKTEEKIFVINDPYILQNFYISGDHIETSYDDNQEIEVHFLDNQEAYVLNFEPINKCTDIDFWYSAASINLLKMDSICEKSYSVVVSIEEKITETEEVEENLHENENLYDREVEVPNTAKYGTSWLIVLLFIGNLYYVYKK